MELFDEKDGMFIGACHYSEKRNTVLEDIVGKMKGTAL